MSLLERIFLLRSVPCFTEFPVGRVAALARKATEEELPAGAAWHEGGFGDRAAIVVEGALSASWPDGTHETIGGGQQAGLVEVLGGVPTPSAASERATRVLLLAGSDVLDLCEEEFDAAEALLRWLAGAILRQTTGLPPGSRVEGYRAGALRQEDASPFVRRLAALAASGLFPEDQLDATAELARQTVERTFRRGDLTWSRDEPAGHFLVLLDGDLRCEDGDGWHTHPGAYSLAGDLEAIGSAGRMFTARAESDVTALEVGVDAFFDILEDHPRLTVEFLRKFARRAALAGVGRAGGATPG